MERFTGPRFLRSTLFAAAAALVAMPAVSQTPPASQPAPQATQTTPTNADAEADPARQGYVLGPNDAITVTVYGQNEFNVQTRIKADGSIVMPLVGVVKAQGETVISLADKIRRQLISGNFLRDPIVNIEVNEYNSRYVRMVGKVGAPSLVPLDRSRDLLDVLLRSGWVRSEGSQFITIRRAAGGPPIRIDADDLARGNIDPIQLSSGDTVYVADAEVVYLTGAVGRPGPYAYKPGMTITELIAQAGGVGATGSKGKVGLKRGDADETKVDPKTEVEPGDIITVRERLF